MMNKYKPRLAWLHPHFNYWTGGTKYILNVIKELALSYDITVFTEDYNDLILKEIKSYGIRVIKISNFSTNKIFYWVLLPLIIVKEIIFLKNKLANHNIVVTSMFPMNIIGNILSNKNHVQFVFEPFAFFHDKNMVNGYPYLVRISMKIASILYGWLDIYFTKTSKIIMTVNKGVSKWIKKVYGKKSTPAYLIVDKNKFKKTVDSKFIELYKDKLLVLHSTDLTPLKRTPFVIKMFKQVVKKVPNALLVITTPFDVSDKNLQIMNYANKYGISKNVKILGHVKNEYLPVIYSNVRCAVYSGIGDGASACSYFVLEVMSTATPVVRTSDSIEEIEDGVSGFLFKPNDSKKMIESVIKLLSNKELAEEMGRNARKKILKMYTKRIVMKNFKQVFKSI